MRNLLSYVFLGLSLFAGYQGYENSRPRQETEDAARREACGGEPSCIIKEGRPRAVMTDFIRRRYEFNTNLGARVVTCRRAQIFLGRWSCESADGHLGHSVNSAQ